jgi:hypothetical protein
MPMRLKLGMLKILTLLWPYCDLDKDTPLPEVVHNVGWDIAKYFTNNYS